MLRFLKRLFVPLHPLDDENLGDKARDVAFRLMEEADVPACLAIYRANEAAHFPPGHFDYYERKLREGQFLTLIATRQEQRLGCCGIFYGVPQAGSRVAFFCFGMVDPAHQRQGIGTSQVLVRIALLATVNDFIAVGMFGLPKSVPFYRRFGFDFSGEAPADDGAVYPLGLLMVSQSFVDDCRTVLARRNITYLDVRHRIPERRPG